ncbi:hypothetical protein M9H77_22208 [Catharanthus roseus]|uniref:Uncharacterized protein n=1 Tax=Catharanthus roseus TaxID=4058 RepID=A0ACC0ARK0_CATRO|nr:hypothetical protein M9H77_22208 [Catharanthus roseus]
MNIHKVVASVLPAIEANQVRDGQNIKVPSIPKVEQALVLEESRRANKEEAIGKAKVPNTGERDAEMETLWEELSDLASFRMKKIKLKLIQEFESVHFKLLENFRVKMGERTSGVQMNNIEPKPEVQTTEGTQATERTETPKAPVLIKLLLHRSELVPYSLKF